MGRKVSFNEDIRRLMQEILTLTECARQACGVGSDRLQMELAVKIEELDNRLVKRRIRWLKARRPAPKFGMTWDDVHQQVLEKILDLIEKIIPERYPPAYCRRLIDNFYVDICRKEQSEGKKRDALADKQKPRRGNKKSCGDNNVLGKTRVEGSVPLAALPPTLPYATMLHCLPEKLQEIGLLLAEGYDNNTDIAKLLSLSTKTVMRRRREIKEYLENLSFIFEHRNSPLRGWGSQRHGR